MTKYHLPGVLLHQFTEANDECPHNHPWGFTSHILKGGYIEEVYTILADGTHTVEQFERRPGTSHRVAANTIHRLVSLLDGDCWTVVMPGPWGQKSGFYRFDEAGAWHRYLDEAEFKLQTPRT